MRDLAPRTLARLLPTYGRDQFDLCEDAVQDALLDAHRQWAAHPRMTHRHGWSLDEQDRARWDRALIDEGLALLDLVTPGAAAGPYLLQTCIAGLHARASGTESTDWTEIHLLYTLLGHITESRNPTITLNRIVAQAMLTGPDSALTMLDELAARHPRLARVDAVRAHLLERSGRLDEAAAAYRRAVAATVNVAEQHHLRARLRRLSGAG